MKAIIRPENWKYRDMVAILQFGEAEPRANELFFARPRNIRRVVTDRRMVRGRDTGLVKSGNWDLYTQPLRKDKKYRLIRKQLRAQGDLRNPYKLYEFYSESTKYAGEAVNRRYDKLQEVFERIRADRYLSLQSEINPLSVCEAEERDGIVVHLSRDGRLIFSRQSYHRLAIARHLRLAVIPICIGVVHQEAMQNGVFPRFCAHSRALEREYWEIRSGLGAGLMASRLGSEASA